MKKVFFFAALAVLALSSATILKPTIFKLDASKSTFKWTGKKVSGSHWGYVKFSDGTVSVDKGKVVGGTFNVDMTSISVEDTKGEWGKKLEGHLKADDFFGVDKSPKSTLVLKTVTPKGGNNFEVKAALTIKGITNEVTFPATITVAKTGVNATASFKIDRTKYGIKYGSGSFFDNLGDKAIDNDFMVEVSIAAAK
ncbi:MAG: YceI family protein [Saprospiraceae bacterium]|nr:YceI family protein [Saprospiraceae bacterium]